MLAVGLLFFRDSQGPAVLFQTGSSQGSPITLTSIGLAFLLPVYTLLGWEGSADLAEETNDPRRTAPRAMIRSVLISGLAGFVVFAVFAMAIPGSLADTVNSTDFNPMVHVFDVQLGGAASDLLQVIVFMSVFSCLLANIAVATRTGFALARDGMLPFSGLWAKVNDRTRTPVAPIVAVGAVAIGVNFLSAGQAAKVTAITSVVCYLTYSSTMVAVMIAKRRGSMPDAGPGRFDIGRWLVPVAVVTLVWCVGICLFMTVPEANRAAGVMTLFFELAGGVWYLLRLRGKIVRGEAGPAPAGR